MKYFKKLVGERIYLSPMNVEDAPTYVRWLNDSRVTDGLGASTRVQSLEAEREWIKQNASQPQFAIVRLADDQLLGNCGFQGINALHQRGEVGLFIGEESNRGKGYGREALKLLLRFGFDLCNLHSIQLHVFAFNERAIRCYQSVGFQEVGRCREYYYLHGQFHDQITMDILRQEWESGQTETKG